VLDPEAATDLLPLVGGRPVDVWARGVLGGGLLALATRDPDAVADDPKAPQLRALADLAARTGTAVDALAVGYVRTFSAISTVLVGIGSPAHLERNLALMAAPPLEDAVLAELTSIAAVAGGVGG
jgi:L-glyceraldehyde 3-phosphate reductase